MDIPRLKIPSLIALSAILVAGVGGAPASVAQPRNGLADEGWRVLEVPGKTPTRFTVSESGQIKATARDSVGFLYRKVAPDGGCEPSVGAAMRLAWRWRVDRTPPPTDQGAKGMDDRPLAVHVWFAGEDGSKGQWSLLDRIGAWMLNHPLPGKALTYVWGGTGQRGDRLPNPYLESTGHIIILRPGDSAIGRWFRESVDIAADYERAFGHPPSRPAFVAISADTDDTRGMSIGVVSDIAFAGNE